MKNRTILVPYDFSDFALEAVDQTLDMSEETTSLHVLHVIEPVVMVSYDSAMPVPPSYEKERYGNAVSQMKSTFGTEKYSRFKTHCETGDPGSEIVKCAEGLRADLIVISSHGRTGLSRLFLGSVAERVLRLATCPVLVLRKPKK